jgi:hypothetical protein
MAPRKRATPSKQIGDILWERVFQIKCKSKNGQTLTDEERGLIEEAFQTDPRRYRDLEGEVFNATVPFGSSARWKP